MDDAIEAFTSVTGQSEAVARTYLGMTDNNYEQAIGLFFEAPELATTQTQQAPPVSTSTRPQRSTNRAQQESSRVINLDSDDDDMEMDDDNSDGDSDTATAAAIARAAELEDDAAMARRMQEELYAGGDASGGFDADGVRAPIARTTETLVGGLGGWGRDDAHDAVLEQMRLRAQAREAREAGGGGPGKNKYVIFLYFIC